MTNQLETPLRLGDRLDQEGQVLEREVALRTVRPRPTPQPAHSARLEPGEPWSEVEVLVAAVVVVGVVVGGVALIRNATTSSPTVQSPLGSAPRTR